MVSLPAGVQARGEILSLRSQVDRDNFNGNAGYDSDATWKIKRNGGSGMIFLLNDNSQKSLPRPPWPAF